MNSIPGHGRTFPKFSRTDAPATPRAWVARRLALVIYHLRNNNYNYFFLIQGAGYLACILVSLLFIASNPVVAGNPALIIVRAFLLCPFACSMAGFFLKMIGWFNPHIGKRLQLQLDTGILREGNTLVMSLLYIMTFGSFIGYARAFAQLIATLFGKDPVNYSWLGPLFGSLMRVAGGFVADYLGGAALTQIAATVQLVSTLIVAIIIRVAQSNDNPSEQFGWFVFFFIVLFTATGLGNASTFKQMATLCKDDPEKRGNLLGLTAAIAAYMAFIIPTMTSAGVTYGFVDVVFYIFAIYYGACAGLNYLFYYRENAPFPC